MPQVRTEAGRLIEEAATLANGAGGILVTMCVKRKITRDLLDAAKVRLRKALEALERIC